MSESKMIEGEMAEDEMSKVKMSEVAKSKDEMSKNYSNPRHFVRGQYLKSSEEVFPSKCSRIALGMSETTISQTNMSEITMSNTNNAKMRKEYETS